MKRRKKSEVSEINNIIKFNRLNFNHKKDTKEKGEKRWMYNPKFLLIIFKPLELIILNVRCLNVQTT